MPPTTPGLIGIHGSPRRVVYGIELAAVRIFELPLHLPSQTTGPLSRVSSRRLPTVRGRIGRRRCVRGESPDAATEALNDFGAFAESLMASYAKQTLVPSPAEPSGVCA